MSKSEVSRAQNYLNMVKGCMANKFVGCHILPHCISCYKIEMVGFKAFQAVLEDKKYQHYQTLIKKRPGYVQFLKDLGLGIVG